MATARAVTESGMGGELDMEPELWAVLETVVSGLTTDVENRVAKRRPVERRWLDNIRQYEGEAKAVRPDGSAAVFNVTRSKCNTFESKVFDMLFPTDDRNGSINPTPVPELDQEAKDADRQVERLVAQANEAEDTAESTELQGQADALAQRIAELDDIRAEARKRAELMGDEVWDNLIESEYAVECRKLIHDGTVAGTGFLKGPLPLSDRVRTYWDRSDSGYRLQHEEDQGDRFAYVRTSYWHLFPDSATREFGTCESWFERHIMRKRDLREFARHKGAFKNAIRDLLREGPQDRLPDYLMELDTIASEEGVTTTDLSGNIYVMWEYRGPLEDELLEDLIYALTSQDERLRGRESELVDPLKQLDVVLWFCNGRPCKIGINHLDDNSAIYNAFQIERSEARLWGPGLPQLMRDQQEVITDGWRAMLENAAYGALPIFEVNEELVQPVDDSDELRIYPGATFRRLQGKGDPNMPGIRIITVPVVQEHWQNIITMAMQFIDTETNISALAQGEQGAATSKTAGGMALLMNSVNVVFRRVIKTFDDDITTPVLGKAYHYLMQFSQKDEIKGDYTVQARGSSVLLVREVQAQNLLLLATQATVHPVLGQHLKIRELMKKLVQSMMLSSDELLLTESELEELLAAEEQAAQDGPPDPELLKLQVQREIATLEAEGKMALAEMSRETEMMKMALAHQTTIEGVAAKLQAVREQNQSKERVFAAEAAVEARNPDSGGSGGYIS